MRDPSGTHCRLARQAITPLTRRQSKCGSCPWFRSSLILRLRRLASCPEKPIHPSRDQRLRRPPITNVSRRPLAKDFGAALSQADHSSPITDHQSLSLGASAVYGRGLGVGRGRGVGVVLGVALGLPVGVAVGVAVAVAVGVGVATGVPVGVAVGV